MTVQKFRSVEEMNALEPRVRNEDAQAAFDRFARHCARYWHAAPRTYPRGVFRFRSIEDAQQARAASSMLPSGEPNLKWGKGDGKAVVKPGQ